jgi:hypothetical protein
MRARHRPCGEMLLDACQRVHRCDRFEPHFKGTRGEPFLGLVLAHGLRRFLRLIVEPLDHFQSARDDTGKFQGAAPEDK